MKQFIITFYNRFANEIQGFKVISIDEEDAEKTFWLRHPKEIYYDCIENIMELPSGENETILDLKKELNHYFGTNINNVKEFKAYFKKEYVPSAQTENLLNFLLNLERKLRLKEKNPL